MKPLALPPNMSEVQLVEEAGKGWGLGIMRKEAVCVCVCVYPQIAAVFFFSHFFLV